MITRLFVLFIFFGTTAQSTVSWPAELTVQAKNELREAYALILKEEKGPFTINFCTCVNGRRAPVADKDMRVIYNPCAEFEGVRQLFCSAYRNDPANILAKHGLYIANIFSNEVFLWDDTDDHHRIAKGFILEKYYIENYPQTKVAGSRAYGGISGSEFEVKYAPRYFARYYGLPDWSDFRNHLIQYELQRRYFLRDDLSSITAIRSLSSAIFHDNPGFKSLRDLIHNQMSPGLIRMIENYLDANPKAARHDPRYEQLIRDLMKLTKADQNSLREYLDKIADKELRRRIDVVLKTNRKAPMAMLQGLSELLVASRRVTAKRTIPPEKAVELMNLNITANKLLHVTVGELIDRKRDWAVKDLLEMARDLSAGVYGAGLISNREWESVRSTIDGLLAKSFLTIGEMHVALKRLNRLVEWGQTSIQTAFHDVREPWIFLFPEVKHIADDIIRSSPLLYYASVIRSLQDHVLGELKLEHAIFEKTYSTGLRALNAGVSLGRLAFFNPQGHYTRDSILAIETTNAELEPVAGIITKDEGNAVSHIQLLARSLGVPNAVFHETLFNRLESEAGKELFYAITPGGKIILKESGKADPSDKIILAEYRMNMKKTADGDFGTRQAKIEIDAERLNLEQDGILSLDQLRRKDSGVFCGPKAAYLGELKHHFPDNTVSGVVIPFGVYHRHFQKAKVVLPDDPRFSGIARAGDLLSDFTTRTYDAFFNRLTKDPEITSTDLIEWMKARLSVIRHSIRSMELEPQFIQSLKEMMRSQGLFADGSEERLQGVFLRSDTNVEDLPDFNGAGLNLTIFNLMAFDEVLKGIGSVWASPFTYRSFSWRQAVISDPNLVFPSIIVMKAVPSEKSGVLITADVESDDPNFMTIATAEGVGGTVDGSPAETLLYSAGESILLAQYKSPTRRILTEGDQGGARLVASSGSETVLSRAELDALVRAADTIKAVFEPGKSGDGRLLPWDIEYGFANGNLYLFQVRPFVGNSDLANLPALLALDDDLAKKGDQPFDLQERVVLR